MKEKVLTFLKKYQIKDGDIIVVGVSGGPDSLTLLSILSELRSEISYSLVCAHVNHNVRKASKKEKIFVEDWCLKNDVMFESMVIEKYGDDNFHNEARHIRYQFFFDLIRKYHAKYLMTAHHADDLMETILMRLARGSTLKGYSGFSECVTYPDYTLLRPLIFFTKEEILSYAKEHKIPYVIDKSNFKSKYTRNRYRKVILPFFKKEDARVHEKFLKFSRLLEQYNQFVDIQTNKALLEVYQNHTISIPAYQKLETIIQKEVLYSILEDVYQDDLMLVMDRHVDLIYDLIYSKKSNAYIYLPNDVKVVKSYDEVHIEMETEEIMDYEIELTEYAVLPNGHTLEMVSSCSENGNDVCRLDSHEVVLPLHVRTRKHGDKMEMKGTKGHRKIKDIMIDSKVPSKLRELWPVVVDSRDVIVWVPGIKKSKFNKSKDEKYDIIMKYH